mgnify:FL=1|tara:strand:+ start:13809 stop:14246 length:438 start_codon:yes stop_codon:yes gene_type:complete
MAHSNLTVTTTYLDIGIHNGAPVNYPNADGTVAANTLWQRGPAGTAYPGNLDAFTASNTESTEDSHQLRLISVMVTGDTGTTQAFDVNAYDSSLNYIYAVVSLINNTDTDESLLAAATTVAHESGTLTFTVGGATDTTLITLIAG